jgi:hypothetical protein
MSRSRFVTLRSSEASCLIDLAARCFGIPQHDSFGMHRVYLAHLVLEITLTPALA